MNVTSSHVRTKNNINIYFYTTGTHLFLVAVYFTIYTLVGVFI